MDSPEELDQLAAALRGPDNEDGRYALGQLQPILVRLDPLHPGDNSHPAEWLLLAGERRWRAARRGGLEHLWAARVPNEATLDDISLLKLQLAENELRSDLSDIDIALAAERLYASGCSITEIISVLRYGTRRTLEQKRKVARELHPDVRHLIRQGVLAGTAGRVLIRAPRASQLAYAQFAMEHNLGTRDLNALVNWFRDKDVTGDDIAEAYVAILARRQTALELRRAGTPVVVKDDGPHIVPPALRSMQVAHKPNLTPDELYQAMVADLEALRPYCSAAVTTA